MDIEKKPFPLLLAEVSDKGPLPPPPPVEKRPFKLRALSRIDASLPGVRGAAALPGVIGAFGTGSTGESTPRLERGTSLSLSLSLSLSRPFLLESDRFALNRIMEGGEGEMDENQRRSAIRCAVARLK